MWEKAILNLREWWYGCDVFTVVGLKREKKKRQKRPQ